MLTQSEQMVDHLLSILIGHTNLRVIFVTSDPLFHTWMLSKGSARMCVFDRYFLRLALDLTGLGVDIQHRVLGDLLFADAYKFYQELVEREKPEIKKLLRQEIPDQESFRKKTYSLTGGRINYIKEFINGVYFLQAIPTGALLTCPIMQRCSGLLLSVTETRPPLSSITATSLLFLL